jgi:hypothetical protein
MTEKKPGKQPGKTLDVTLGTKDSEGKTTWKPYGRVFVLEDVSEGSLYVGNSGAKDDEQKKYKLVPKEGVTKTGGKTFEVVDTDGNYHARLFLRPDMTGGALWVGQGDDETQYAVFARKPRGAAVPKPPAAPKATAAA